MVMVETGGNGDLQIGHLGEVGTFAAEKILHVGLSFGLPRTEEVNKFSLLSHILLSLLGASSGPGV